MPIPGPGRRLMAMVYDSLLLAALLMVAAVPWTLLAEASAPPSGQHWAWRLGFQLYLLAAIFAFFGWFWTHGGQTLGMRAWRLRLVDTARATDIGWRQAAIRFAAAILSFAALGAGYWWALVDRNRYSWHDRLSASHLILLPGRTRRSPAPDSPTPGQPTRRNM